MPSTDFLTLIESFEVAFELIVPRAGEMFGVYLGLSLSRDPENLLLGLDFSICLSLSSGVIPACRISNRGYFLMNS